MHTTDAREGGDAPRVLGAHEPLQEHSCTPQPTMRLVEPRETVHDVALRSQGARDGEIAHPESRGRDPLCPLVVPERRRRVAVTHPIPRQKRG